MAEMEQPTLSQQGGFQPSFTEEQLHHYLRDLKQFPNNYNNEQKEALKLHADHYGVHAYTGEFGMVDALKQLGGGFIEGFTTLNIADAPDNEYEAIIRNIGHLAGFAPGIVAGPAKFLGLKGLTQIAQKANRFSVPMLFADYTTKKAKGLVSKVLAGAKTGQGKAGEAALGFLMGHKTKHIAEGAFHLGAASAISNVWGGIDGMMDGFIHGGMAGGAFRTIGNFIKTGDPKGTKMVRGLAGSLLMGVPSTLRGATTEEQVYDYLMGAYFGGKETPWSKKGSSDFIQDMFAKREKKGYAALNATMDPALHPKWESLPSEVKAQVEKDLPEILKSDAQQKIMQYLISQATGTELPHDFQMGEIVEPHVMKELVKKNIPLVKELKKGKKYTFLGISGGAKGTQSFFSQMGEKFGVPFGIHTTKQKLSEATKAPGKTYVARIRNKDLQEARGYIEEAARTMPTASTEPIKVGKLSDAKLNELASMWVQMKNTNQVVVVGQLNNARNNFRLVKTLEKGHKGAVSEPSGNERWAVELAKNNNKEINVYDQSRKNWYEWNPALGKFVVSETPELSRRFAAFGTENLWTSGKNAIAALYAQNIGRLPKDTAGVADIIKRNKQRIGEYNTEIKDLETEISAEKDKDVIADKELTLETLKARRDKLQKDVEKTEKIKVNEKEIRDYDNELDKLEANLTEEISKFDKLKEASPEWKKQEEVMSVQSELIKEITNKRDALVKQTAGLEGEAEVKPGGQDADTDIGTGINPENVGKKSDWFVKEYMNELLKKQDDPAAAQVLYSDRIGQLIMDKIEKGAGHVKSESLVKDIEKLYSSKDFKLTIPQSGRDMLRRWMTVKQKGRNEVFITLNPKSKNFVILTDKKGTAPVTGAGNRKIKDVPKSLIEVIQEAAGNDSQNSIAVFDHITVRPTGSKFNVDMTPSRYRRYLLQDKSQANYNKKVGKDLWNETINKLVKDMNQNDMYLFGGKGDKDEISFIKYHPELDKFNKGREKLWGNIRSRGAYKESLKEWKDVYKLNKELHDNAYMSNILYELSMNGLEPSKGNFKKLLNPEHFIPNAIAFNKRAQIWLNSSWSGDSKTLVKEFASNKEGWNDLVLDPADKKYKLRYMIHEDKELGKGESPLDALNIHIPEGTDGAIITRNDAIDNINRDAGVPETGQNKSFIIGKDATHGALLGKYMMHNAGKEVSQWMADKNLHFVIMKSSAKQVGTRNFLNNKWLSPEEYYDSVRKQSGEDTAKKELEKYIYNLDPSEIFYNHSTINDHHMVGRKKVVKQFFTSMSSVAKSPAEKEMVDNVFNDFIRNRFEGESEWNNKLTKYVESKDNGLLESLSRNIDRIGISELLKAVQEPGNEKLAERFYGEVTKVNRELIEEQFANGEINASQKEKYVLELETFASPTERKITEAAKYIARAERRYKRFKYASCIYDEECS